MASDHGGILSSKMTPSSSTSISPHTAASLVLIVFLLFLLSVRTTSAARYHHRSTSSMDIGESTSTKRDMIMTTTLFSTQRPPQNSTNGIEVHQYSQPPLPKRRPGDRVFNAGAHEVPSGPNPISNRFMMESCMEIDYIFPAGRLLQISINRCYKLAF